MRVICLISLLALAVAGWSITEGAPRITSGPGVGVLYGGVGVGVEYHADDRLSFAGGVNPFESEFRWTLAALYHPDPGNRLRFSAGLTNALEYLWGDDDQSTEPFIGLGWGPTAKDDFRGWNFDLIFGDERTISVGYSF
ncbi:MAG: hypothetical protein ACYDCO_23495 [Armatimonadota bacterium]